MSNREKILIALLIVLLAAASRLLKHPFNFTPIAAMALFAGCYLKDYKTVIVPFGAMLISDYIIGFYDWQVMVSVYISIGIAFVFGKILSNRKKWYYVAGMSLASSVSFFLITNFAVWAFFDWYPHTWQGLISDFTLALPFFRNTLLGDIIYSSLFFAIYEVVLLAVTKKRLAALA